MEKLTGKTYSELFDEYIVKPYNLKNTHVIVPKEKRHLTQILLLAQIPLQETGGS